MSGLISYSELQQSAPLPVAIDYPAALALRQMALIQGKLPKYLLAPEVSALHHYVPDLHRRMLLATLWNTGTVAKLAMRQPFVLFKGLTFQKLCLP
ncbi:hypothetical protein NL454_27290, partial [Klebsiella pneumoniae]|nr:hypothetical protein [Klebsiella pneumoniae]